MGLPALYYSGRENPPHPEIWINYFLRMMELYSKKVYELSKTSENDEGYLYCKKQISKEQLMKNSLFIALETAASAGGAALGKHIFKKHPVIGAIAGSILGSAGIGCVRKTVFA